MIINLTLLIQVANFFFAYLLLKIFFLIPVLKFIRQDEQRKRTIEQVVLDLEEQVISAKKKQQKQQDDLRLYFVSHKPPMTEFVMCAHVPVVSKPLQELQAGQIATFKQTLKTVLQKKLWL